MVRSGACDGFWVSIDVNEDGIDAFVDEVVPLLQERGFSTTTTKAQPSGTTSAHRRNTGSTPG